MLAVLLGKVVELVRLPALLGMLIAGIIVKNLPGVEFDAHWKGINSTLRSLALIVILTRAGLGKLKPINKKISRVGNLKQKNLIETLSTEPTSGFIFTPALKNLDMVNAKMRGRLY